MSAEMLFTELSGADRLKQERVLYSLGSSSDTNSESDSDLWAYDRATAQCKSPCKPRANVAQLPGQTHSLKLGKATTADQESDQPVAAASMTAAILNMLREGWVVSD